MNFLNSNNNNSFEGITNNLVWEYSSAFKLNDIYEMFISSGLKNVIYNGGNCKFYQFLYKKYQKILLLLLLPLTFSFLLFISIICYHFNVTYTI